MKRKLDKTRTSKIPRLAHIPPKPRGKWTLKELEKEWPEFKKWLWEVHHNQTADGPWLIDLWYEYLEDEEKTSI